MQGWRLYKFTWYAPPSAPPPPSPPPPRSPPLPPPAQPPHTYIDQGVGGCVGYERLSRTRCCSRRTVEYCSGRCNRELDCVGFALSSERCTWY